jgi:anti-sigma-K factor RskA
MSGRVLRFEGSAHSQATRLLPWYVNGTLEGEELSRFTQHLAECAQCRAELDEQRQLQSLCARGESASDVSSSFARLRGRLQEDRGRPRARWEELRRNWKQAPAWLRVTLAAQFCAIFALVGVLVGLDLSLDHSSRSANYRTLGDAPTTPSPAERSGDAGLVAVFDPALSHAELQQLLRASGTRIVDGPNAAGAYVLAVPADGREAALAALRGKPGVTMVESLEPERKP